MRLKEEVPVPAPPPYTLPCPAGTPAAERFVGLPARIEFGPDERFALAPARGAQRVHGAIRVTMRSGGETFYDGVTDEARGAFFLQLDLGDRLATVTATFLQAPAGTEEPCVQTISERVRGFRRFRLAGKVRPQALWVEGRRLRGLRWRHWNAARATATGTLRGRPVAVAAFRVRGGQGAPYRYTRVTYS